MPQYPLQLRFKIIALAPQLSLFDQQGSPMAYVRQKIMRFREHVEVFTSKDKNTLVAQIKADKVIDWSARYYFTDPHGSPIGSVGRRAVRSLWKATYYCFESDSDTPCFVIEEENPIAKVFDSLIGGIPLVGFLTAVLFQPRYAAKRPDTSETVMRLTKKAAFFEGRFQIDKLGACTSREELSLTLSYLMLTLLERDRG